MSDPPPMPILYLPHGGGPLPLLGDPDHQSLADWLAALGTQLPRPRAVLVISAHWEQTQPTLTSGSRPALIYDYYGFPAESYRIQYPAPGATEMAGQIADALGKQGFAAQTDATRGFDHGLFVPLKLIYPQADIPCLQLSLLASLDPAAHIALGQALAELRHQGVLIVGSGMSFHNLRALLAPSARAAAGESAAFDQWLNRVCCDPLLSATQRRQALIDWEQAPDARFCHPRAEHLLPLHVCMGAALDNGGCAHGLYRSRLMGQWVSAFRWG